MLAEGRAAVLDALQSLKCRLLSKTLDSLRAIQNTTDQHNATCF